MTLPDPRPRRLPLRRMPATTWKAQEPTWREGSPAIIGAALKRALARPSGNWFVLAASGDSGKLYRVASNNVEEVGTVLEPEITALGRDAGGKVLAGGSPDGAVYRWDGKKLGQIADTPENYIWGFAQDGRGGTLIATGNAGKVYRLGDAPGQGSKVKIINQLLAGVHIAASAEAMALGLREGVDPEALYEVITHSAGNSWMFENRVPHMLDDDFTPKSAVDIWVKDLALVLDTGRSLRMPLPMAAAAFQVVMMAAARGLGAIDDAAFVKVYEEFTGERIVSAPTRRNDGTRDE